MGLWLLLAAMETARPAFFLHDDNATWFVCSFTHDFRVLTETGRFAEVNYFQYGGEPFLEQGQTGVLYPPVYLAVALAKWVSGDGRWAIEWIAAIHLTLALIGFYFWVRQSGVAPQLAALAALAWVLNPFLLIVGSSWIVVTFTAAWLPWSLWALDRLLNKPSARSAIYLGIILGLFFLQGYIQWFAYSLLALGFYLLFNFTTRAELNRLVVVYYLAISALIFAIFALPILFPMAHAVAVSAKRAEPLSIARALYFNVTIGDLARAQLCHFVPKYVFGTSSAFLYCPALLLLPLMVLRFFLTTTEFRRRLFPLLFLTAAAILFSSHWHVFLSMLPLLDRFRWPFKVFILVDFFALASLVQTVASWRADPEASAHRPHVAAILCLSVVLAANAAISLGFHTGNSFSPIGLANSVNPIPPGVNPRLGRVITIDRHLPEAQSDRYLTHIRGTYFEVPSLGGYNPLVGREQLRYSLGLDFPNVFELPITPEIRAKLDERAVRYWMVDPQSPQLAQVEAMPGFKQLDADADRVVFEDTQAAPLAASTSSPTIPVTLTYSGNSLLIPLTATASPLAVSLGPTDGWWYRIDHGAWIKPVDRDDHLLIPFSPTSQMLEITFFDARFQQGLWFSALLAVFVGIMLVVAARRKSPL